MAYDDPVTQAYLQGKQKFDTLSTLAEKGHAEVAGLGSLHALGQNVTKQDVFKEALGLMSSGHAVSRDIAQTLSTMPPGGPALAEWVADRYAQSQQHMQAIGQAHEAAREELAGASLHKLFHGMVNGGNGAA